MRVSALTAALSAALFCTVLPAHAVSSNQAEMLQAKTAAAKRLGFDQVSLDRDGRQNALITNYGTGGNAAKANAQALRATNGDAVTALFHGELGALAGLLPGSAMQVRDVTTLADGTTYYNLEQSYQGLPVVGDEVTVQLGADGVVQAVFGSAVAIERVDVKPKAKADAVYGAAFQAALREGVVSSNVARSVIRLESQPRLVVLARRGSEPVLAWEAVAAIGTGDLKPFHARVYADAASGKLLDAYTLIRHALHRTVYDSNNGCWAGTLFSPLPGTQVLTEGGSTAGVIQPAINAYNAFGNVYHYFKNAHGIDSYDNKGAKLKAYVRLAIDFGKGCDPNNAAWGGGTMYMGAGSATVNDMASEPDVTYHEFGHGVTTVTSNLEYRYESGGLNEAASDIYAAAVEAWINTVPGGAANSTTPIAYQQSADIWTIGEGLRKNGVPFRTMGDPASDGRSLDRYSQYVEKFGSCTNPSAAANDNCGVHTTSGIANLAFHLLTNGGAHPRGATNVPVAAIPFDRAIAYFYDVHKTKSVGTSATFSQMRNAMQARARANGTVGLCDEISIARAWASVGVAGIAPQNPAACGSAPQNDAPTASFATVASGLSAIVDGRASNDYEGPIASYAWNFGDNSTATGSSAVHTYAAAGTYTVSLTVTDGQGATHSTTQQVTIGAADPQCPGAAFSGSFAGATGQNQYQPTAGSYTAAAGAQTICVTGLAGTNFTVALEKELFAGYWFSVANSADATATKRVTYNGQAGKYRVRVTNTSGTGPYVGTLQKP